MEYIVNEIPVKTTNSFNLNNLKLNIDLPTNLDFHDYNKNYHSTILNNFNSNIGLTFDKYLNTDIIIDNNDDIELVYEFSNNDTLIDNINLKYIKDISNNIIIKYISKDNGNHFHHLKLNIDNELNSKGDITIINMLNTNSTNMLAVEINNNANINLNIIDLGSKIKINNIKSLTNKKAISNLNNIYIGLNNDIIDMNYDYINKSESSTNIIEVQGLLNNNANKKFRGTIDFLPGSSNSIGKENENVLCLSDKVINRSVPILLCGEENVSGSHSVSSSKIDKQELFYLMSKGIDEISAKKMIILGNFNKIIKEINNQDIENEIIDYIDNLIID